MDGGIEQQDSRRTRALIVAGVFVALVAGLVLWQRATTEDWNPVTASPALPPSPSSLSFATPEQALDNFLEAFNAGEYELASEMLSQSTVAVAVQFNMDGITTLEGDDRRPAMDFGGIGNTMYAGRHIIGEMMELASLSGSLPIDLSDGIADRSERRTDGSAEIAGELGNGLPVSVTLSQGADGSWRIDQLSTPGGDPDRVPFSARPGDEPPARAAEEVHRFGDRFAAEDPETFAVFALRLVEARDHFSLVRILGSSAWWNLAGGFSTDASQLYRAEGRTIFMDWDAEELQRRQSTWGGVVESVWDEAVELGAMYVDPVGPYTVTSTEAGEPELGDPITVVTVTDSVGTTHRVSVIDVGEDGWRLHQILADGGDPDILPLSGPTGLDVPPGMVGCWDHVRYDDCDRVLPIADPDAIREIQESDLDPVQAAAELANLQASLPALAEICAAMQGQRDDLVFSQATIELAPSIVDDHCPGDPSLLVVDPEG